MATITPTFSKIRGPAGGIDAVVATWTPFAASGDVGQALQRTDLVDRSVQVTGTFSGATIVFEGSNDGTNYFTLSSPAGLALQFTTPGGLMQVTEATAWVRPRVTAGSGASLTVTLAARRTLR
jgi:hypothetical protein